MANPLMTGVSGLSSHQKMIEIVGHNLANLNTIGYKARSAQFSDVMYEMVRAGTGGSGGSGGTNPVQVGTGSQLAAIAINYSQGNLQSTGSQFDVAIEGDGFFVVRSGEENLYTRAGAFQVDKNGLLVDAGTGYPVQRFGTVGESIGEGPAFQTSGRSDIQIPLGAAVPGRATETVNLNGNLPSTSIATTTETLESALPYTVGGLPATELTLLNDLDFVTTAYQGGDELVLTGTDRDGSPVNATLAVDGTTTLGDLLNALNAMYSGATVTLANDGTLELTANESGRSFLSLSLADAPGNTGQADLDDVQMIVSQAGENGTIVYGGMEVYDDRGGLHVVSLRFQYETDGTWTMTAHMDASEGTIVNNVIGGITFGNDGTFQGVNGDSLLAFQFSGQPQLQAVQLNLGSNGKIGTGMSSYSGEASLGSQQDGYPNGTLVSVQIGSNGVIEGIASNGLTFPLAQLATASFRNPQGLESVGNNFLRASLSSGEVQMGTAGSSGNGRIRAGQLEQSNVDIAAEFTRLIIAQRGFSANARTITVADELLTELNSLVRR